MSGKNFETQLIITEDELDFGRLFRALFRNSIFIALCCVFFGVAAFVYSKLLVPQRFESVSTVIPTKAMDSNPQGRLSSLVGASGLSAFVSSNLLADELSRLELIFRSRTVLHSAIGDGNLVAAFEAEDPERFGSMNEEVKKEVLISILGARIQIERVLPGLVLRFESSSPQLSASVLESVVRAAQSFIEGRILTQARATEIFVGERLADARARLKELQNQFVDLQGSKGVVQLSSQSSLTLNQAAKLRARIMDKEIQLDLYKDVLRDSGELVRLKAEKDQLQAQLDSLMGGGAQRNGSRVKEKVMDVFTPLNLVPSMEKDFAAATLDHTTQAKLVELLQEQFELAKIDSKKNQPGFEVIDPPLVPMFPSGPNVKLYVVVGTLFGAFFSVVSVLTLNLFGLSKLPRHVGRLIVVEQSKPLTSDRLKASAHR